MKIKISKSSLKAFMQNYLLYAFANPEAVNSGNDCYIGGFDVTEEEYENIREALSDWYVILDDAIARGDKEEIASIRRSIQFEMTRILIERKLNEENITLGELLTA